MTTRRTVNVEEPLSDGAIPTYDAAGNRFVGVPGASLGFGAWAPSDYSAVPLAAAWTAINIGAAVVSDLSNAPQALRIENPGDATNNLRGLVRPIAAIPYRRRALVVPDLSWQTPAVTEWTGMWLRESGTGKVISFAIGHTDAGAAPPGSLMQIVRWTNPTTFSAIAFQATGSNFASVPANGLWLEIQNDGVNRKYRASSTGRGNYVDIFSEAAGTFLTEDQAGFMTQGQAQVFGNLYSWLEA